MDFRFYFSLFLRRLHWFLLLLVLCSAVGIALAWLLPTVYEAEAKLVVESEQIPDSLAASTVQTQATEQLQIIQQRILTRDTLIEMANRLQIYPDGRNKFLNADEIVEDLRKRISIVTTGGTVARGPVQATLVTVSFTAPTAILAATVTNEVVTLILKEDVAMRTSIARQTLDFFDREVARLGQDLSDRNAAILEFKQAHNDALPDSLEFRRTQQAAAQERLLQMDRSETELRDRRSQLVRLHEAVGAAGDPGPTLNTPEARALRDLQAELSRQQVVLAPGNPRIKMLEAQISAQEKIVNSQLAGAGVDAEGKALSAYDIQLADLDSQLTFIDTQRKQVEAALAALEVSINATPGNAITLGTLQRDFDNVQAQYNDAVAKKAKAATGDMIEALSKGQRISVIEQAVAPREPTKPNRPLIAVGGVAAGLTLGLGLVVLIEVLSKGIRRPAELTAALGITSFATLPFLETKSDIRRRLLRRIGVVVLVVAGISGLLWAVNTYYMPLDLLIERVMQKLSLAAVPRPAVG